MKTICLLAMCICGFMTIFHLVHGNYVWALIMAAFTFLNYTNFKKS